MEKKIKIILIEEDAAGKKVKTVFKSGRERFAFTGIKKSKKLMGVDTEEIVQAIEMENKDLINTTLSYTNMVLGGLRNE